MGLASLVHAPRDAGGVDPAPVRLRWPVGPLLWAPGLASDDGARALGVGLRVELHGAEVGLARTLLRSRFTAAVRCESGWVFATEDGRAFGGDTFLSPLRPLVRGASLTVTPWSRGLAVLLSDADLWLSDGRTAWPVAPRDVGVRAAAFDSPARGVAVYRDGSAAETRDRGAHWRPLDLPAPARDVRFDGRSLVIDTADAPVRLGAASPVATVPMPARVLADLDRAQRRDDPSVVTLRDGSHLRAVPGAVVLVDAGSAETRFGLVERGDDPSSVPATPTLLPWGDGGYIAAPGLALRVSPDGRLLRVSQANGGAPEALLLASDTQRAVEVAIPCAGAPRRCVVRALGGASPTWRDVTFPDITADGAWQSVGVHGARLLLARAPLPTTTWATLDLEVGTFARVAVNAPSALGFAHDGSLVGTLTAPGATRPRLRRADGSPGPALPDGATAVAFADVCRGLAWGATLADTWRTTTCGATWERVPTPQALAEWAHPGGVCDEGGCVVGDTLRVEGWGVMTAATEPQDDTFTFEHEVRSRDDGAEDPPATMTCVEGPFVARRGPWRIPPEVLSELAPTQTARVPAHPNGTTRFTWRHRDRVLQAEVGGHWCPDGQATVALGPIALMTATTHIDARERERHDLLHMLSDGRWRAWAPFGALGPRAAARLGAARSEGSTAVVVVSVDEYEGGPAREFVARIDASGAATHAVVRELPAYSDGVTGIGFLRRHAASVRWTSAAPSVIVALDDPSVREPVPRMPRRLVGCLSPRGAAAVVMRTSGGSTGHRLVVTHPSPRGDYDEATPLFRFRAGDLLTAARVDVRFAGGAACVETLWLASVYEAGSTASYCRLDGAADGGFTGRCASRDGHTDVRCSPR